MVNFDEREFKVQTVVFEARFDQGDRYFDLCGQTVVRLRRELPQLVAQRVALESTILIWPNEPVVISFDPKKVIISRSSNEWTPSKDAEKHVRAIAPVISKAYPVICESLEIPNTTRVGARFSFIAEATSLEDAQRVVAVALNATPFAASIINASGKDEEVYSGSIRCQIEDVETGFRTTVMLSPAIRTEIGEPDLTGLPGENRKSGVLIDIDTFTRPPEGHFDSSRTFFENAYHRTLRMARRLFADLSKSLKG